MYRIMIEMWLDGERVQSSWYTKYYVRKGNAENVAREMTGYTQTYEGKLLVRKATVVNELQLLTKEEAKEAYSHYRRVWVEESYGLRLLPDPGSFGSHAPATELFYRTHSDYYKGNYWVEAKEG